MRNIITAWVPVLAALAFLWLEPVVGKRPTSSPSNENAASNIDPGTKVVRSFYDALLQNEPPIVEQDNRIFKDPESWRRGLVISKKLRSSDPLLAWFRQHRDLFIPRHMRTPAEIQVSSTFNFACNLLRVKGPKPVGSGLVMVLFVDDPTVANDHRSFRTLVFNLENGKIDPGGICLNGFGGKETIELLVDPANEPADQ